MVEDVSVWTMLCPQVDCAAGILLYLKLSMDMLKSYCRLNPLQLFSVSLSYQYRANTF